MKKKPVKPAAAPKAPRARIVHLTERERMVVFVWGQGNVWGGLNIAGQTEMYKGLKIADLTDKVTRGDRVDAFDDKKLTPFRLSAAAVEALRGVFLSPGQTVATALPSATALKRLDDGHSRAG